MEEYIEFDFYLEIENVQYGRMLAELFENLTEGCLEQFVYRKREEDEVARLIGRYTELGDKLTKEESKILRVNGYCVSGESEIFKLIGRDVEPGDKVTDNQAKLLRANGYNISKDNELL